MPDKGKGKRNASPAKKIKNTLNNLRGQKSRKSHHNSALKAPTAPPAPQQNLPLIIQLPSTLLQTPIEKSEDEARKKEIKRICDVVAKRKLNAYLFFTGGPNVEFNEMGKPKFILYNCAICRAVVKQGASGTDTASTGSLLQHAHKCWGQETVDRVMAMDNKTANNELCQELKQEKRGEQSRLTLLYKPLKKSWDKICLTLRPSKESIRLGTARMCAEEGRPFNTVSGRCYKWLQCKGQPNQYVPSRQQVSKDVKTLYTKAKQRLAAEPQAYNGEHCLALDCWTSPDHWAWMSINISRLHKGDDGKEEAITHLLDFIELPCSHSGLNMAQCVKKVLQEYGIGDKLLSITVDNASANNTMVDELKKLLPHFLGRSFTGHTGALPYNEFQTSPEKFYNTNIHGIPTIKRTKPP